MAINISRSPCYECKSRHAGCHTECGDGQKYIAELTARNREIKAERDKDTKFNAYKADRIFDTKRSTPSNNMRPKKIAQ